MNTATYATKTELEGKLGKTEAEERYPSKAEMAETYATKEMVGSAQGTRVTSGGVVQGEWNADTKLDASGTAMRAIADANGNTITTTYATKTDANAKLDKTGTAARATADANGNVIAATYATKAETSAKLDKNGGIAENLKIDDLIEMKMLAVRSPCSSFNKIYRIYSDYFGVSTAYTHLTVKTRIRFVGGQSGMYTLNVSGFHYHHSCCYDFRLWFYVYQSGFYAPSYNNAGGACMPDAVKLFTYFDNGVEYVAFDMDFGHYSNLSYASIDIDIADSKDGLRNVERTGWEGVLSDASSIPAIGIDHCSDVTKRDQISAILDVNGDRGYRIRCGRETWTGKRDSSGTVLFDRKFSAIPHVILTPISYNDSIGVCSVKNVTVSGFSYRVYGHGSADTDLIGVNWMAIGQ